jgi:hypothetical protein
MEKEYVQPTLKFSQALSRCDWFSFAEKRIHSSNIYVKENKMFDESLSWRRAIDPAYF